MSKIQSIIQKIKEPIMICRIIMTVLGVVLTGVSVAIFRHALLGVDPYNCLVEGVVNIVHITYGTIFSAVQAVLLVVTFILGRKYIGLGTILSMFCIGPIIDAFAPLLNFLFPGPGIVLRFVLLIFGFVLLCFAASLYMTSNLGVSAYDAMALIMHDRLPRISFRLCRIMTDVCCVVFGFFYHANIGIATVGTAFCMGPLIQFFNQTVSVPLLKGRENK